MIHPGAEPAAGTRAGGLSGHQPSSVNVSCADALRAKCHLAWWPEGTYPSRSCVRIGGVPPANRGCLGRWQPAVSWVDARGRTGWGQEADSAEQILVSVAGADGV